MKVDGVTLTTEEGAHSIWGGVQRMQGGCHAVPKPEPAMGRTQTRASQEASHGSSPSHNWNFVRCALQFRLCRFAISWGPSPPRARSPAPPSPRPGRAALLAPRPGPGARAPRPVWGARRDDQRPQPRGWERLARWPWRWGEVGGGGERKRSYPPCPLVCWGRAPKGQRSPQDGAGSLRVGRCAGRGWRWVLGSAGFPPPVRLLAPCR